MSDALLKELCPVLAETVKKDAWKITREERSDSFDNAIIELKCDDFATRVIRDRGMISIDLASPKKRKWISLETVLSFVGETVSSRDPDNLSELLAKNFGKIAALMTCNTDGLEKFEKERSTEFIKRIFPSS